MTDPLHRGGLATLCDVFKKRTPAPQTAQQIWNQATTDLMDACKVIYTIKDRPDQSETEKTAEFKFVVGKLTPAYYAFEQLVERDVMVHLAQPMATGTRDLLEGMLNVDRDRIEAGLQTVKVVMASIFEPDS